MLSRASAINFQIAHHLSNVPKLNISELWQASVNPAPIANYAAMIRQTDSVAAGAILEHS